MKQMPSSVIKKVNGTSLQGYLEASYKSLVNTFGEPFEGVDKTDAEWVIYTPEGIATIYNYKDGKNYLGDKGMKLEDITEWHVGGKSNQNMKLTNWLKRAIK